MFPRKPLRISTDLDVIPFSAPKPPGDLGWLVCEPCQLGLQPHQPDPQAPARLLGFCEGCGRWYLILMEPNLTSALMVALPESQSLLAAWEEHGGPDGKGTGATPGGSARDGGPAPADEEPIGEGVVKIHVP